MAVPTSTVWDLDPHTGAKHEILRRYLGAWFPILASSNGRVVFIDGFCGPGKYSKGEPGSPIIALQEAAKQGARLNACEPVFIFMDEDPRRVEHLRSEIAKFSFPDNFRIDVIQGEFENEFCKMLDYLDQQRQRMAPTFAFIDPFGFAGLPYDLVARLLKRQHTEVLINFMVAPMNRFMNHPKDEIRTHMDRVFGMQDVADQVHGTGNRVKELRLLYQEQLLKVARYVRYFEIRDASNRPIYDLFFATNHPLGLARMKEAFWKVDPNSGSQFSDATNPDQLLMFSDNVELSLPLLERAISAKFDGKTVQVDRVLAFVNEQTGFLEKHGKAALRNLEMAECIAVLPTKADGKQRRKGTFPTGVVVTFPSMPK